MKMSNKASKTEKAALASDLSGCVTNLVSTQIVPTSRMTSTKKAALSDSSFRIPWTSRFDKPWTSYVRILASLGWMSNEVKGDEKKSNLKPPAGIGPAAHRIRSPGQYQTGGCAGLYAIAQAIAIN